MFCAIAVVPLDRIHECLSIIKEKSFLFTMIEKNLNDFVSFFERTWINGVKWMKLEVWNYFDYIVRRTNNDLESFNKEAHAALREKKKYF